MFTEDQYWKSDWKVSEEARKEKLAREAHEESVRVFNAHLKKMHEDPECMKNIKAGESARSKILIGLIRIYDGYENIPSSCLGIVNNLTKERKK